MIDNEVILIEEYRKLIYSDVIYEDFEISNTGKLRNVKTGTNYKVNVSKTGYYQVVVSLGSRNNIKRFTIHRCIACTFIPRIEGKNFVNHKDCNKLNNSIDNLEWCTNAENIKHAFINGRCTILKGTQNITSKLTYENIVYVLKNYVPRDKKYGMRALARLFGVSHEVIHAIVHKDRYIEEITLAENEMLST